MMAVILMNKIFRLAYSKRRIGCCCLSLVFRASSTSGSFGVPVVAAAAAATATSGFITNINPTLTAGTSSARRTLRPGQYASNSCSSTALFMMSTWSTKTTFEPSEPPPGTRGTPVFDDIDFSVREQENCESMKRNQDPQAVFVVTGANRGIGLEFVKTLLQRTKGTIVACCRSPETATELQELSSNNNNSNASRIILVRLELENQESIEKAGQEIQQRFSRVDLLLNVAGILGDGGKTTPGPERSLSKMDRSWLEKSLAVNVIGPVMLTKELSPLLMHNTRRSNRGRTDNNAADSNSISTSQQAERPVSVVVNLSARVGSITDNGLGGWYSYRMSKAALNQATRTMALELQRHLVWCVALHPGTTDTNLSKPFQNNVKPGSLFPVEFTVDVLLNVIDSLQQENSGGFYDWAGKAISF